MNLVMICFAAQFFIAQSKVPANVQVPPADVVNAAQYFDKECKTLQEEAKKEADKKAEKDKK